MQSKLKILFFKFVYRDLPRKSPYLPWCASPLLIPVIPVLTRTDPDSPLVVPMHRVEIRAIRGKRTGHVSANFTCLRDW